MWSWARWGLLSAGVSLYYWLRVADGDCRGRRQTLPEAKQGLHQEGDAVESDKGGKVGTLRHAG